MEGFLHYEGGLYLEGLILGILRLFLNFFAKIFT